MTPHAEAYRAELLAVMYRWAHESDLTMREWLEATHDAIETVLLLGRSDETGGTPEQGDYVP